MTVQQKGRYPACVASEYKSRHRSEFCQAVEPTGSIGPAPQGADLQDAYTTASKYLRTKLRRFGQIRYCADGETLFRFPGRVRGNSAYAAAMRSRRDSIQTALSSRLDVERISARSLRSNLAFITLTTPSNATSFADMVVEWQSHKKKLSRWLVNMGRQGVQSYVYGVESNSSGGYHVHLALILNGQYEWEWVQSKTDPSSGAWRSDYWRGLAAWYWGKVEWAGPAGSRERVSRSYGFVDVKGGATDALVGYVTKELFKYSGAEQALKADRAGTANLNDYKKILTFALATAAHYRQFGTSRDIVIDDPDDGNADSSELVGDQGEILSTRLDSQSNNSSDENPPRTIVLSRIQLARAMGYSSTQARSLLPWSAGQVDPETAEYRIIMKIILGHKNVSFQEGQCAEF